MVYRGLWTGWTVHSEQKLPVSQQDFEAVVTSVKGQCKDAVEMLTFELDMRFREVELMNALGVVFLSYWL
jgi:hypothetical protein